MYERPAGKSGPTLERLRRSLTVALSSVAASAVIVTFVAFALGTPLMALGL